MKSDIGADHQCTGFCVDIAFGGVVLRPNMVNADNRNNQFAFPGIYADKVFICVNKPRFLLLV
ncbi:MAG: hypothetical protein QM492_01260 [Rhodobacterales bacterium]